MPVPRSVVPTPDPRGGRRCRKGGPRCRRELSRPRGLSCRRGRAGGGGERKARPSTCTGSASGSRPQAGQPLEQGAEADAQLQAGQVHPQALVATGAEGEMGQGRALEVPLLGLVVAGLVAVGRAGGAHERHPLGDRHPVDLDGTGGLPVDHGHRRLPAQGLLHHGVDQAAVGGDPGQNRRMGEQGQQATAHDPERGLGPGREQQPQEPVDVFVAQSFAVDLGRHDVGDQVVGGLGLALFDQGVRYWRMARAAAMDTS